MSESQLTDDLVRRREPAAPAAPLRRPMMDARRLTVHSVRPLNAETSPQDLGRSAITSSELLFVRTHGVIRWVDVRTFRITVGGDVRSPVTLGLPELRARFPRATLVATVACAGNRRNEVQPAREGIPWGPGAIGAGTWSGVRLRDVLLAAGPSPQARHVGFTGLDTAGGERFAGSIPIEKALAAEVLLADELNGAPLPIEHGFPLRAVVPGYIGARSVKWLAAVTVTREPSAGHFQREDYARDGVPLGELPVNSAICRPGPGAVVGTTVRAEGYAIGAAGRPVGRVEVSSDGGRSWAPAVLDGPPQAWTWRLWHADLSLLPGGHELVVRAVDDTGARQPAEADATGNPRGYLNNAWHRVRVVSVPEAARSRR